MKRIALVAVSLLLFACGGGQQPDAPVLSHSTSSTSAKLEAVAPVLIPGERRSYALKWSDVDKLQGTSKVPGLADFRSAPYEIRLRDISLSYDLDGSGGQIYRLYQAAFGRTPDVLGLGYWKEAIEKRGLNFAQVGTSFLDSAESKALYGTATGNEEFVARLYMNVLGRSGDSDGTTYWIGVLKSGQSRTNVLLSFAESEEFQDSTSAQMLKGIAFAEPGVGYSPVANALGPSAALVGSTVELDGASSSDANGDNLSYTWSVSQKPITSSAAFTINNVVKPKIRLDMPGTYQFTLWVNDATSKSYSPGQVTVLAVATVADTGEYTCYSITAARAVSLFAAGHVYLDRNKDGIPCNAADTAYESSPPVTRISDSGNYRCSTLTHASAVLLYLQGHTYLDRDRDGKPCESTDHDIEKSTANQVVVVPPNVGQCWVNGYTRKNGTRVSGYWRRC